MVAIARTESLRITLEGIETAEHIAAVAGIDCDALQGYGLGLPQTAADFEHLLVPDAVAVRAGI